MKKRKRKVGKGFKLFAIVLVLTSLFLLTKIIYINILSNLLLSILSIIFLIIDSICIFLLLKSNHKKIGLLVSGFLIITFSLLTFYLNKTTNVFANLNLDYKTYNYSIIVLNNSKYDKIKDLKNKNIGYYDEESEETTKSLTKLKNKVSINLVASDDIHNLRDELINGNIEAVLIEKSYLDILNENVLEDNTTFKDKIKEIYNFSIKIKIDDIAKDLNVTKEPFNIYISGIDTYGEISSVSRSDVNMVVTINPSTNQVLLTSIPRDYYVKLYNKIGYKDKITHAGLYGTETSIKTIEDLLNIEINYYIKLNFSSVLNIVNALDGVSVYSEYEFTSIDNYHYEKGYNNLNGEEALSFARERKSFALGDRQRIKNQQALLNAIIDKCLSPSIIKNYSKLLDSAQNSFITNMRMNRITSLVKMQLTNNYSWTIVSNNLNGIDAKEYTYSAPNTKVYVMSPVEESIEYAIKLINKVENDEILDKELILEEQKEIIRIVNVASINAQNNIKVETPKKNQTEKEENNTSANEKVELTAKLLKPTIEFTEGDEYIYHGIKATYGTKDITKDNNLKIKFRVADKEFDDYRNLIYYVSHLKPNNYIINYIITYENETLTLNQQVNIKKIITNTNQKDEFDDELLDEKDNNTPEDELETKPDVSDTSNEENDLNKSEE